MPRVAGLEDQVTLFADNGHTVGQRPDAAPQHEAVLVFPAVPVQGRGEGAWRQRVLDEREAAAGIVAVDHESHSDGDEQPGLPIVRPKDLCFGHWHGASLSSDSDVSRFVAEGGPAVKLVRQHRKLINTMPRKYELKRRAENAERTRERIVEAAIELHGTVGPGRTTVSAIAGRAGVERQTYYRHFPDDRSLFTACTSGWANRHPLPDAAAWRGVADPQQRLEFGFNELYSFYAENESMLSNVIRDAQSHALTAEMAVGFMAAMSALGNTLAEAVAPRGMSPAAAAMLDLALDFTTWRGLVRRSGLDTEAAVDVMVTALRCVVAPPN